MISLDPIFDGMAFGCGFASATWSSNGQVQVAGIALMAVVIALRSWVMVEKFRMIRAVEAQKVAADIARRAATPWK